VRPLQSRTNSRIWSLPTALVVGAITFIVVSFACLHTPDPRRRTRFSVTEDAPLGWAAFPEWAR
jgi:hypothetical protein